MAAQPIHTRFSRPPAQPTGVQQQSFISFTSTQRPLSSSSSISTDPFASVESMNQHRPAPRVPDIPIRSHSRPNTATEDNPARDPSSNKRYVDEVPLKAASLLSGVPSKSPKAIEVFTGLQFKGPASPAPAAARKPKQSSTSSYRRSLAISTNTILSETNTTASGRFGDDEDLTYTAPSSASDRENTVQRQMAFKQPAVPVKSAIRNANDHSSRNRKVSTATTSSGHTVRSQVPPLPSIPSPTRYRSAVSSADLPPPVTPRSKPAEPSTGSGGTRTLACLYLVSGLPKECVPLLVTPYHD